MSTPTEFQRVTAEHAALLAAVEALATKYTNAAHNLSTPQTWGKRAVYLRCRDDLRNLLGADS